MANIIKMTKTMNGSNDGRFVSVFHEGVEYKVVNKVGRDGGNFISTVLANIFLNLGYAVDVEEIEKMLTLMDVAEKKETKKIIKKPIKKKKNGKSRKKA